MTDLKAYYESEIQILRDKLKLRDLPQDLEKSNQTLTERFGFVIHSSFVGYLFSFSIAFYCMNYLPQIIRFIQKYRANINKVTLPDAKPEPVLTNVPPLCLSGCVFRLGEPQTYIIIKLIIVRRWRDDEP